MNLVFNSIFIHAYMKKIIVFGFPHCGTSILKSIIGHIDRVDEIYDEEYIINSKTLRQYLLFKKYVICKYPFTLQSFFNDEYQDYIKIFIVRNPLWVFSSLNKRFSYKVPDNHGIAEYVNTIKHFIHFSKHEKNNLYLIRYEDMFDNDYRSLKDIFNSIGFKYSNEIFNNSKYKNKIISRIKKIPEQKPDNRDHGNFRTYQINQPFINNNINSKIDLTDDQLKTIKANPFIKEIYPELQ